MNYIMNPKTNRSYAQEFLNEQGNDIRMRVEKAIGKIESGHIGHVSKIKCKNEKTFVPLKEYIIDYKQGFRIYFSDDDNSNPTIFTIGTKKSQKKDIQFCHEIYNNI